MHSSDNETVLGSNRKLGGAAKHLIDGSEKLVCRLLLKGAVMGALQGCANKYLAKGETLEPALAAVV